MFIKELSYFNTKEKGSVINLNVEDGILKMGFEKTIISKPTHGFKDLECALSASKAKKLKDDYYSAKIENNKLFLNTDDYEVKINTMDFNNEHVTEISNQEPNIKVELNKAELLDKINKIKPHILSNDDPLAKKLAGLYFNFIEDKKRLDIVASDSYKLGIAEFTNLEFTIPEDEDINTDRLILNRHDVNILEKICKDNKNAKTVIINILDENFKFEIGEVTFQAPIVDVTYPNYLEIVSGINSEKSFALPTKDTDKILTKAKQLFSEPLIRFESENNIQTFKVIDDVCSGSEMIPKFKVNKLSENVDDILVRFSVDFVKQVIDKFKNETFIWIMTSELGPSQIFEEKNVYFIVMPTRSRNT